MMQRTNANARQTEIRRNLCLARDGSDCHVCHQILGGNTVAEIHHIDGNSDNNPEDGSNWALVHHSCNVLESYVKKRLEIVDGTREAPIELSIGSKMELRWFTGALEADCSPETTKRYLMKHVVDSNHKKALFKSALDSGYNSLIKFSDMMEDYVSNNNEWK
jgi:hypothetical protein